jgi:hypothetical protein
MAILDLDDDGKKPVKATAPAVKPGYFDQGGQGDAAIRGFANGATFGLAPKISAGINSLFGNGDYQTNLKQYLDANRTAQASHPTTSLVGNVVGSLPSTIVAGAGSLPAQIAKSAALGAADTYGSSTKSGVGAAKDVATGAVIGGAAPAVLPGLKVVGKSLSNIIRGVPDAEKIAEAAIKYKNAPLPSSKGLEKTGAANKAFKDLKSLDVNGNPAVGDQLIRETGVKSLDKATLDAVIKNANATRPSMLKEVIPSMAQHSAYGAGAGFVTSGGDIDTALAGGLAGLGTGAATGVSRSLSGPAAKLRMPDQPRAASKYDVIGDTIQSVGDPLVKMGVQGAVKDVKEVTGTSTSPFGKLTSYINQAAGATNPAVQQVAEQAQGIAESNDSDAKRKAAMVLQDTPEGRAVGNSSSNVRDLD